jgi:DeoR/GlpR family transcriptional regulator of sugar metabolism
MIKMREIVRGEKRKQIHKILMKKKKVSLKELRHSTKINYNTIRSTVISLTRNGLIERVERGVYKAK